MADTSKLNKVTEYIIEKLSNEFGIELTKKKLRIGKSGVYKEFTGVSNDNKIVLFVCHHSGLTSGDNIPTAKLNSLFTKCYLLEKVNAEKKYIYFTNIDFYEIFRAKSNGIIENIELKLFNGLPVEYENILSEVIRNASREMS